VVEQVEGVGGRVKKQRIGFRDSSYLGQNMRPQIREPSTQNQLVDSAICLWIQEINKGHVTEEHGVGKGRATKGTKTASGL
jgi:predicted transcriptional regulator